MERTNTKRPLKDGGTTGNAQIDSKLRNQSEVMAKSNPKSANIHNNFEGGTTTRERSQRWPSDS